MSLAINPFATKPSGPPVQKSILHYFGEKDACSMNAASMNAKAAASHAVSSSIDHRLWRLSLHIKSPLDYQREWEANFRKLRIYQKKNGHCNVPLKDGAFGRWVGIQREQRKCRDENRQSSYDNPPITDDQIRKLDSLRFCWSLRTRLSWDSMYTELLSYKGKHGHCRVPQKYVHNKALGRWVGKQRQNRKKNQLNPDRINRLDQAGFVW
jgi:hypothetical protein